MRRAAVFGNGARRRTAALAAEALVVTYPLVLTGLTRDHLTGAATPGARRPPVNRFAHAPAPRASSSGLLTGSDADTLTSSAWLDLSGDALVLSVPDTGGRYLAVPVYDAWSQVVTSIGARTTGTGRQELLLAGPTWPGPAPPAPPVVRVPTSMARIVAHVHAGEAADAPALERLRAGIRLTPWGRWRPGRSPARHRAVPAAPPAAAGAAAGAGAGAGARVVTASPPAFRLARMLPEEYFTILSRLLPGNPPHRADRGRVESLSALGVLPGRPPAWSDRGQLFLADVGRGMSEGLAHIAAVAMAAVTSGWACPQDLTRFSADPLLRAASVWTGLGSWPREDALFYTTTADIDGRPLTGDSAYIIRFPSGRRPPARAFWSLAVQDDVDFFVRERHGPVALRDRQAWRSDDDGGLTIRIQAAPPDQDRQNWLEAPPGRFRLVLSLYWPHRTALDGGWVPPSVTCRTGSAAAGPVLVRAPVTPRESRP